MKTKNKTRYLQSILGAILAVSAALVLSCEQPDGSSVGAPEGKGGVAITVSTGGPVGSVQRTITPTETPTFTSYDLVFESQDEVKKPDVEVSGVSGTTIEQVLDVGEWKVTVTGYQTFTPTGGEPDSYKAATGTSEKFTITAGSFAKVSVDISPIGLDDPELEGIFAYDITYPDGATGILTLTLVEEGEEDAEETTEEATTVTLNNGKAAGSTALAPGYYTLKITLTKDKVEGEDEDENALVTGDSAGVYIYAGLESKAEFTFTDKDFVQKVYITGIIPRLTNAVEFVADNIKVYGDSGFEEPFDAVTEIITADKDLIWYAEIPAANIGKNFYVKAETTNNGTTYTATYSSGDDETLMKAPISEIDLELKVSGKVSTGDLLEVIGLNEEFELGRLEITNPATATPINFGTTKVTVTGDSTIPANVTVQFDDGEDKGSFTVVDGATLTVAGAVDVSKAAVQVAGTLNVTDTGKLTVARPGWTVDADAFGEDGTGKIVLKKGSTLAGQKDGITEQYLSSSSSTSIYSWSRREADGGEVVLAQGSLTLAEGPLTVNKEMGIPKGYAVTIEDDAKLTIAPTVPFTVSGELNVADKAEVTVNGILVMAEGSSGDLDGTITVASGGVSKDLNSGGGSLWLEDGSSTGEYVFKAGAKAYIQRSGDESLALVIGSGDDKADIMLTPGATFYNGWDAYTLDGNATIANAYGIAVKKVTIEGVLTVDADLELIGATNLVGYEGSRIVLKKEKEIIGVNGKNFYTAAGKPITKDITASTGDQVFAWSYDVGEDGGWQGSGAGVPIYYEGNPEDVVATITGLEEGETLYKTELDTRTVKVTGADSYKWELNGVDFGKENTSLTLNSLTLAAKKHRLTVIVTKDSKVYSKEITFTVALEEEKAPAEGGE